MGRDDQRPDIDRPLLQQQVVDEVVEHPPHHDIGPAAGSIAEHLPRHDGRYGPHVEEVDRAGDPLGEAAHQRAV